MKYKDISEKIYDKMLDIFFDNIKDLINWKSVEIYLPNKIKWYSKRKRCHIILALHDALSNCGAKFNKDADAMTISTMNFLYNFRPTRSVMYMKAYRNHYLVDVFGIFTVAYDQILKKSKYSHEDALQYVLNSEVRILQEVSDGFKMDSKRYMDLYDEFDINYNEAMLDIMDAGNEILELVDAFKLNRMRSIYTSFALVIDLQSLYTVAVSDSFKLFQDHSKYDQFSIEKKKKNLGELLSTIIDIMPDISDNIHAFTPQCQYDRISEKAFKTHDVVIETEDEAYRLRLSYENPCIL